MIFDDSKNGKPPQLFDSKNCFWEKSGFFYMKMIQVIQPSLVKKA